MDLHLLDLIELLNPFDNISLIDRLSKKKFSSSIYSVESVRRLSALLGKKYGHVYIIKFYSENNHWWKIGTSEDPKARLTQLQAGNPYDLFFDFVNLVENPFAIESALQTLLNPLHERGEWFMGYDEPHFALIEAAKLLIHANHLSSMRGALWQLKRIEEQTRLTTTEESET